MAKTKVVEVTIGQIVTVRDRSKPVGYQIVPAIVTFVHNAETGVICATGFPRGGATYDFPSLPPIDVAEEEPLGWYATETI